MEGQPIERGGKDDAHTRDAFSHTGACVYYVLLINLGDPTD
jgi:hypothetical protein